MESCTGYLFVHFTGEEKLGEQIYFALSRDGLHWMDLNNGNPVLLSDIGEIRRLGMPSGADRFDHLCHDHYHARCVKCGRVFDVEMEFIADLKKNIKDTHRFEITGHDIIFKGICLECNI